MSKAERDEVSEQLRRARSWRHLQNRIRSTKTPRKLIAAYMDFITAHAAHAGPADQRTIANRLRALTEDLKRGR